MTTRMRQGKTVPDYTGHFVFLERVISPMDKDQSTYDNGEYFCVHRSPGSLYCIKAGGALYEIGTLRTLARLGARRFAVLSSWKDDSCIQNLAKRTLAECEAVRIPGAKKEWAEHVYTQAAWTAASILRNSGIEYPEAQALLPPVVSVVSKVDMDIELRINGQLMHLEPAKEQSR